MWLLKTAVTKMTLFMKHTVYVGENYEFSTVMMVFSSDGMTEYVRMNISSKRKCYSVLNANYDEGNNVSIINYTM